MAKKSPRKTKGQGKAKRKASRVKDLPAGSRSARTVKGGSFSGKLSSVGGSTPINKYTVY